MSDHPFERLPVVFFGHGSPMNALQRNRYTESWRQVRQSIPKPRTILAVSAHWYIPETAVTAMAKPETIHDFGNFPRPLFEFQYRAPGDPELAARVRDVLAPVDVKLNQGWGLDHGTWSVLAHVFSAANVPVVQLSIDKTKPARFHYDLGRRLAPLRDEGVLIVSSGNVVHNLGVINWSADAAPYDWAVRFNGQVRDCLMRDDHEPLIEYEKFGEDARLSIPTPEHYLPLLYILGLQAPEDPIAFPVDGIELGSISMLSVAFGLKAADQGNPE